MISPKDLEIISHLRNNARKKITDIAEEVNIPATTIYDKLRAHTRKGIVKKHVTLLDFSKLGYHARALVAFKSSIEDRENLLEFLSEHPNVNSLYRVNFKHDFLVETVFENASKLQDFIETAKIKFNVDEPLVLSLIDELRKEEFLSGDYNLEAGK